MAPKKNSEQKEKLIDEVKKNSLLFDTSDVNYKNTKLKLDVWAQIASTCNIEDGAAAKEMWKNLTDCFRAARKRKQQRSGDGATNEKKWDFEDQMMFLKDYQRNIEPTYSNVIDIENIPVIINSDEDPFDIDEDNNSPDQSANNISKPGTSKRTKKASAIDAAILTHLKRRREVPQQKSMPSTESDDPLKTFFLAAYQTTKTLKRHKQIQIKKLISDALLDAELEAELQEEVEVQYFDRSSLS